MKFDINNYKGNYVMHCKTEREAEEFCAYLREHDIFHNASTVFSWHRENTCFNFNAGMHSGKDWYESKGYTILEWSDFTTEFTKTDLKDGMVVELACGIKCLVLNNRIMNRDSFLSLDYYTDDLKYETETINAVYTTNAYNLNDIFLKDYLTLIWERKEKPEPEPVEMTLAEVCKALGKEIKIVKE